MKDSIERLRNMIRESSRIAFLGGAGVSTESGIPDFRSEKGIFAAIEQYGYTPEVLLSHEFFMERTDTFYRYYRDMLLYPDAQPNPAHFALAALERQGKLTAVITQNIDGLHQRAGSKNVLELHGSVYRNFCTKCKKAYSLSEILAQQGVPKCNCGGIIKPDVVLYGEELNPQVLEQAISHIRRAQLLIVGGTSLVVYPAAGLVHYLRGGDVVLINKGDTAMDSRASLVLHASIGEVLPLCVGED
jgi:NAD-dependent deacetylase